MKFTRWDDTALSSWIYLLFFLPLLHADELLLFE